MFSQTAEYALRAVVYLAYNNNEPQTTHQIAEGTKVPVGYLSKVLQTLSKAGIIQSQRGIGGGSCLARPAADITVYDVVQVVDPVQRIHTCPLGISAHGADLCLLHRRLDDAAAAVEDAFRGTTIGDVVTHEGRSKPLCGMESRTTVITGLKIESGKRPLGVG